MAKKIEKTQYTTAQKKVIEYFKELCETDPVKARDILGRIIRLRAHGARIEGTELAQVFDKLGYFGAEEVSKTTWDFCDELTGMYKRLRENDDKLI